VKQWTDPSENGITKPKELDRMEGQEGENAKQYF
jgi:hypothetical protein